MQENTKTSKWTKLRIKENSRNFIMSACWEPVVNFVLMLQMQGSKKVPFGRPGRVGFLVGQVTLSFKQFIAQISSTCICEIKTGKKNYKNSKAKKHI